MRRASCAGATSGSLSRVCMTELKSNGELACKLLPESGRPEKSRDKSIISSSGRRGVKRPASCGSPPRSSSTICSPGIASSAPSSGKHHAPAPCARMPLVFRPRFAGGGPSREAPPSLRFALFAAAALGWFSSLPRSRLRRAASSCFASAAARFSAAALSLSATAAAFSAAAFSAAAARAALASLAAFSAAAFATARSSASRARSARFCIRSFLAGPSGRPFGLQTGTSPFAAISSRRLRRFCLRISEFHRFLMALSVRPGSSLTMKAHLVPCSRTLSKMTRSSSGDQPPLRTSGQRLLNQRSRHCLPARSTPPRAERAEAMLAHLCAPSRATSSVRIASSSAAHDPLVLLSPSPPSCSAFATPSFSPGSGSSVSSPEPPPNFTRAAAVASASASSESPPESSAMSVSSPDASLLVTGTAKTSIRSTASCASVFSVGSSWATTVGREGSAISSH
mmetsp:Transcript_44438/g.139021  ORF Transcript_44438/g.139021 Transcript_44438/m.139021 type:complete len:454 (+) Transcript_44438:203-1564(+)